MRLRAQLQLFRLFGALAVAGYCAFDEEPMLEVSDWSIAHAVLLLLGLLSVCLELTQRAQFGHLISKDVVVLGAVTAYAAQLHMLVRVILVAMGVHATAPFELDLAEGVDAFSTTADWLSYELVLPALWLTLALGAALLTGLALSCGRRGWQLFGCTFVVGCLGSALALLVLDLGGLGFAGVGVGGAGCAHYGSARTALTAAAALADGPGGSDPTEWCGARRWPYAGGFESLYCCLLQLVLLWELWLNLLLWTFLWGRSGWAVVSYTQLAYAVAWLEQAGITLLCLVGLWALAGLRLCGRLAWEGCGA